ncbi:type IV pilus assembly protein PilQ [Aromatoleum tolulyticum]|uniref:Type IV pilus biogenesis and competence protein PilQ n=1 Tax=Aromatoleum tolulyticum TaxID=34027 RepID=A0A1N6N4M7_9RHOO|nr:type IV pilus secretin family protein [Aromatoleum tolulyticum]SIP87024.1 type IV pilus assembly protein PilQ [Aromatoleum tolulyticum]
MNNKRMIALLVAAFTLAVPAPAVLAQAAPQSQSATNSIDDLEVSRQGGSVVLKLTLKEPLAAPPASFSVANPARIAFDFPGTTNGLGRSVQEIDQGDLRSANIVQSGDRTRLVLNVTKVTPFESRIEGRSVIISLGAAAPVGATTTQVSQAIANFAAPKRDAVAEGSSIRDINFRRGKDGEGRVVVQLSSPDAGIDIRQQGGGLVVEFLKTSLPEHLRRRSDVTDFATPVTSMTAQQQGDNVRLQVTPNGKWEHNAYQSDNQFVLEVRRVVEDPNKLVQGAARGQYKGDKLSLNFQNIDVRSVLQVIADFTNFNIITSDSVQGNLTLRLKDVPWDQALDIILQAKGLDMRKSGNVIWIAPGEELATREKLQLEAKAQIGDLEPLQTESFQINYHKSKEIFDFLKSKDQTMLSKRGSVVVDERSNRLFVTDVASRLAALASLIKDIDVAPRQVMIEARVVEANKDFARDLGVRLGYGDRRAKNLGDGAKIGFGSSEFGNFNSSTGEISTDPDTPINTIIHRVGENAVSGNGFLPTNPFGALNLTLFNRSLTRFLNLELAALESDGRGRVVSSPRILTANQVEATIKQGQEILYVTPSSGTEPPTVSFKDAVLMLKVRPQITPDGRIQLKVEVSKDRADFSRSILGNPPIDKKSVTTEVMVENGGTVVIGGVFEEEETTTVNRVPLLGEIPYLGALFRSTNTQSSRRELLVFLTPRIVSDALTLK